MVWRRITNESQNSLTCEMLEEYLRELVLDLNLQLLWEWEEDDLLPQEKLLWVDGITITAYENIHGSEKAAQSRKSICANPQTKSGRKSICSNGQADSGRKAGASRQTDSNRQANSKRQSQPRFLGKIRDCLLVLWRIGQLPYP